MSRTAEELHTELTNQVRQFYDGLEEEEVPQFKLALKWTAEDYGLQVEDLEEDADGSDPEPDPQDES